MNERYERPTFVFNYVTLPIYLPYSTYLSFNLSIYRSILPFRRSRSRRGASRTHVHVAVVVVVDDVVVVRICIMIIMMVMMIAAGGGQSRVEDEKMRTDGAFEVASSRRPREREVEHRPRRMSQWTAVVVIAVVIMIITVVVITGVRADRQVVLEHSHTRQFLTMMMMMMMMSSSSSSVITTLIIMTMTMLRRRRCC